MLLRNLNTITLKTLKNCAKLYKSRKVKSNTYNNRCLSYCRLLKTILFKFSSRNSSLNSSRNNSSNSSKSSKSHHSNSSNNNNTLPLNKLRIKLLIKTIIKTKTANQKNKTLTIYKPLKKDSPLKFLTQAYCLYLIIHNYLLFKSV